MQDMSAFFSIRPDGTATEIHCIGNGALWALHSTDRDAYENVWRVWRSLRRRNFHALPEEKGTPVAGTGGKRWRKWSANNGGVSAGSHVVSHHYANEGDKGRTVRKLVRNRERALWLSEWQEEQNYSAYDSETVAQWFYDNSDDVDSDIIPSVYTVGETVVEWPNDYYDEYEYDYSESYGCGDPYCDICGDVYPYDYEEDDDWCGHCGGPCEL